ncbi:MAG: TIGR01777 family oxidoreductase [Campylobacterales bacterium]|nr:TIGR01777 family oxidoreductase [Campylobacterales bacterium]
MKVAIAGASGFVGSFLSEYFAKRGCEIAKIGIKDFESGLLAKLEGAELVVNLAGAPIIGRWSEEYKKILVSSRLNTTNKLAEAICAMDEKPKAFFCASAVGYYDEGDNDEYGYKKADDFLGELCENWESAAKAVEPCGVKCVNMRFGIVIGKGGGALAQMLPIFKAGLGGKIGSGEQGFSWIHLSDLARAIEFLYEHGGNGAYNFTAPHPTTNAGLTKALGSALHRPTIFPVPEFALRLVYSEGAKVLTSGQKVYPKKLLEAGFAFEFEDIAKAVADAVL